MRTKPISLAPVESDNGGGAQPRSGHRPGRRLAVATDLPDMDAYEVRVYDDDFGHRLVAAVEIVSPSNKDRPEHRRAFVAKCATLLRERRLASRSSTWSRPAISTCTAT